MRTLLVTFILLGFCGYALATDPEENKEIFTAVTVTQPGGKITSSEFDFHPKAESIIVRLQYDTANTSGTATVTPTWAFDGAATGASSFMASRSSSQVTTSPFVGGPFQFEFKVPPRASKFKLDLSSDDHNTNTITGSAYSSGDKIE